MNIQYERRGVKLTPYGDRVTSKVHSIVLRLKSRYSGPSGRIKTGFSDGGAWERNYLALCLRDSPAVQRLAIADKDSPRRKEQIATRKL